MRLLFVCAGAQPGADGVGDYTRRLAGELSRLGHSAALLAIHDRHVAEDPVAAHGELRLSKNVHWRMRLKIANEFIREFHPDVISLQFVNYGFSSYGLPLNLASKLKKLSISVPWHVMLHELWIEPQGSVSNKILSTLQKAFVVDFCRSLKPDIIHTSNSYYCKRLEAARVTCKELPLFGNIPVIPQEGLRLPDEWVFAFFGSLRKGWEPEPLLSLIEKARIKAGKARCRFISVGRLGDCGQEIWYQMTQLGYESFKFDKYGELTAENVSSLLLRADFGIAVSPLHLIGKSGAVAAMFDHGLPVIVSRLDSPLAKGETNFSGRIQSPVGRVILLDDQFSTELVNAVRSPCRESLAEVAQAFLHSLSEVG